MIEEGKQSKRPLTEAFGQWSNAKIAILALFGATAGEAVVWYGGQFYALFFLTQTLKVPGVTAQILIAIALADRHAVLHPVRLRCPTRSAASRSCSPALRSAAVTYFPIFQGITHFANPKLEAALADAPVTVTADPSECSFQFKPTGTEKFTTGCDIIKAALVASVGELQERRRARRHQGEREDRRPDASPPTRRTSPAAIAAAVKAHGYPAGADPNDINYPMTVLLLAILVIYVTMVYGPIAAWLVELFPTRIRYSGLSLPYHIGNGWFGGFLPATVFAIVAATGNIYSGLWYPIVIAAMSFVIGLIFLPETKDRDITKDVSEKRDGGKSRPASSDLPRQAGRTGFRRPSCQITRRAMKLRKAVAPAHNSAKPSTAPAISANARSPTCWCA